MRIQRVTRKDGVKGRYVPSTCSESERVWSYIIFLYSTPFLVFSMIFSLLYVHLYRTESELAAGALPPYPDPHTRTELSLVLGEVHHQLVPKPSPAPQWLSIPERGLYTGVASFGSIGSGKTYGLILPAMRQLYRQNTACASFCSLVVPWTHRRY
jgi:hypothetical protein